MTIIEIICSRIHNNLNFREEFTSALVNGSLIDFLLDQNYDLKISELTELIDILQEKEKSLFQNVDIEIEESPFTDMPPEIWNEMAASPFKEDIVPPDYLINYNEKFKTSRPILFRDEVIRQILSCLIGKYKPNVLLVGAAGTGKTAIVEDIARMLANEDKNIPPQLKGYIIWELPLSDLAAGCRFVGDIEEKTKSMLAYASSNQKVILFVDEIHVLMSDDKPYGTVSQILKPALARGSIRMIGATTLQEANFMMRDPAFARRFQKIIVDELTKEQTQKVLLDLRPTFRKHYGDTLAYGKKVIVEAVKDADEYKITGTHRPDNAVALLDRTIADTIVESSTNQEPSLLITPQHIKNTALKLATGRHDNATVDLELLRKKLSVIRGQEDVMERIIDCIKRANLDIFPRTKPLTMLMVGSSGVGKSKCARCIAHALTGYPPITLNMTEFSERSSLSRIVGVHAGYVGCDSRAEKPFDILESNPRQVILLDEFEKCHRSVKRLFMSVFDNGILQMSNGNKAINFTKCIIVCTSNAGSNAVNSTIGFTDSESSLSVNDLTGSFETELLNRFSVILPFHQISEQLFREIVRDRYTREVKAVRSNKSNIKLPHTIPDDVLDKLVRENYNPAFGARPVSRIVRAYIEDYLINADQNERNK